MKKILAAWLVLGIFTGVSHALNNAELAIHIMKALNLDTRADVKVLGSPVPSGVGSLNKVSVTIGGAPYDVYITKDEKKYFWGILNDFTQDPDKMKWSAVSLKNVHSRGSDAAPVTIVEFSDFQCGHCKVAHEGLKKELYKEYKPSQVRLIFKHFPLTGHDWAEPAAVIAECASKQGEPGFFSFQDFFFSNQEAITKDNLKEKSMMKAKELGLDTGALESCMASPAMLERVQLDKKEGTLAGVQSTPTLLINGRVRRGYRDFSDVKVVIDEKLKAK